MGVCLALSAINRDAARDDQPQPLLSYYVNQLAQLLCAAAESAYAHSTMETKVETMNCIEKYL